MIRTLKVYSAAAFEFQDMRDLIFGVLEASYGIGFTLGPLIGQLLYAKYGFRYCFLILSGILTLPMPLIYFMSFAKEEQLNMSREKSKIIEEEITYGQMIFGNKRTVIHLTMIFGCIVCMIFYEPLLSNQLISMNVSINNIGKTRD